MKRIIIIVLLVACMGAVTVSAADSSSFSETNNLNNFNTAPSSIAIDIRVDREYSSATTAELKSNSPTKYTLDISSNSSDEKTYFIALDDTSINSSHDENPENFILQVNGENTEFEVEEHLGKQWIKFEASGDNVLVNVLLPGSAAGGLFWWLQSSFFNSPISVFLVLTFMVLIVTLAIRFTKEDGVMYYG